MELNSREIAILIWLGLLLAWAMRKRSVRQPFGGVVRALLQRKIVLSVVAAALYSTGCVWLLRQFGLWEWTNLKTTLLWGLGFAFVTMMDIGKLEEEPAPLRRLAKDALSATAIIIFIAEFYTLPLWGELLLVPLLVLVVGMIAVGGSKPEHAPAVRLLTFLQVTAGLSLLAYSLLRIIEDVREFTTMTTAREFGVPILLSLMFLPFLYLLILWVAYENAMLRLHFTMEDRSLRRYAILRGMLAFGTNLELFRRLVRGIQIEEIRDRAGVRRAISQLRVLRRRERDLPSVDWTAGWSPYAAREFLAGLGLRTNDYHRGWEAEWWAESPILHVEGGVLPDGLIYRIAGTEAAATRLSLELNGNALGTPQESTARFVAAAVLLIRRALGDDAAEEFSAVAEEDEVHLRLRDVRIELTRSEWGHSANSGYTRRLVLLHPAHQERYPGLE